MAENKQDIISLKVNEQINEFESEFNPTVEEEFIDPEKVLKKFGHTEHGQLIADLINNLIVIKNKGPRRAVKFYHLFGNIFYIKTNDMPSETVKRYLNAAKDSLEKVIWKHESS